MAVISKGSSPKRTLPKPKLNIHPSQLPTLATFYAFQNEVKNCGFKSLDHLPTHFWL
jgi:hypothetical protein